MKHAVQPHSADTFSSNQLKKVVDFSKLEHTHRQQVFWQIALPIAFGGLVVLAFLVLAILATFSNTSTALGNWRDISLIFMILPTLLVGLVFVAIFGGLIYLMTRIIKGLPSISRKGQIFMASLSQQIKKLADRSLSPVFSVHAYWAGVQTFWRRIF